MARHLQHLFRKCHTRELLWYRRNIEKDKAHTQHDAVTKKSDCAMFSEAPVPMRYATTSTMSVEISQKSAGHRGHNRKRASATPLTPNMTTTTKAAIT